MKKNEKVHISMKIIKNYVYHWHPHMTIIIVASGSVSCRIRGVDYLMLQGDILVLNQGDIHKITAATRNNSIITLSFDVEFCFMACNDFADSKIVCNSVVNKSKNIEEFDWLRLKLNEILRDYLKKSYKQNIYKKARELIKYLCHNFDYISRGNTHQRFSEYIIKRYKIIYRNVFLEDSELTDLTLKELASYLGVNYTYLRTDIVERFGKGYSVLKYTEMTQKAARMMLSTEYRLVDISNRCGFSDPKYLRKYIKQLFECTPSEFRKKYKQRKEKESYTEIPIENIHEFLKEEKNET